MANIVQTQFAEYTEMYAGKLDHFEQRGTALAALKVFQEESNPNDARSIISPEIWNKSKESFGIDVNVPVMEYFSPTLASSRSCSVATEGVVSDQVAIVFSTYRAGFMISPDDNVNNKVPYKKEWIRAFDGILEQFGRALDSDCVDFLDLNKNTLWTGIAPDYYTQSGDVLQVPNANKDDFYNQLQSIYQSMDYSSDEIKVVSSPRHTPLVRRYSNQGEANAINTAFQFGPYQYYPTNRVVDSNGVESTVYSFPKGSVGMMTRLDPSSKNKRKIHEGNFFDVMPNVPILNSMQQIGTNSPARIDLGVHYQANCGDITALKTGALAGLTAAVYESWVFSFDVAYLVAFNSRATASPPTDYSPILKHDILAAS